MNNLFGLPTPGEVRENANRRLFGNLPYYNRGVLGQANMGAAAIGMGLSRLFGGQSAGEQRAQSVQDIQKQTLQEFGDIDQTDMGQVSNYGQKLAKNLMLGGFTEHGIKVAKAIQGFAPQSEDFTDFLKEERKSAGQSVKAVNSRASTIRGSYGKLQRLNKQAKGSKKGSTEQRSAINSMIANVVRLNSPGIVSETELQTYTGGQGTTAALLGLLRGKGLNTDAWAAGIDASGNADPDALLRIGENLILSEAAPLFDQYEDAKNRASRAKMSGRAQSTIFGESKNLNALKKLTEKVSTSKTSPKVRVVDW